MIEKRKPVRNKKYTDWVKTLDCCLTGAPADDPHHIIGVGDGGMKACDLFTMPLTREAHTRMHDDLELRLDQWEYVAKTLQEAVRQGVLVFSGEYPK